MRNRVRKRVGCKRVRHKVRSRVLVRDGEWSRVRNKMCNRCGIGCGKLMLPWFGVQVRAGMRAGIERSSGRAERHSGKVGGGPGKLGTLG